MNGVDPEGVPLKGVAAEEEAFNTVVLLNACLRTIAICSYAIFADRHGPDQYEQHGWHLTPSPCGMWACRNTLAHAVNPHVSFTASAVAS